MAEIGETVLPLEFFLIEKIQELFSAKESSHLEFTLHDF